MKVILLSDVSKLGRKFDVKEVNSGHALNFLIPKKLAVAATPAALKRLETEKNRNDAERKIQEELLVKNLSEIDGKTLNIKEKVNEKGHLFASLHKEEIAQKLAEITRVEIDPENLVMEHPIKEAGEHEVEIKIGEKSAKIKVVVGK